MDVNQAEISRMIESLTTKSLRALIKQSQADPVYLILSSKRGLLARYEQLGFDQVHGDLIRLRQAIEEQTELTVDLIYVDDEASLAPYEMTPVDSTDPMQIKVMIDQLDDHLGEAGMAIEYLLIVGGDTVLPFHRLPNPVDDQDVEIPTDNPYASRDANTLIPERAVGRMPDGGGTSVDFLHRQLQTAIDRHQTPSGEKNVVLNFCEAFLPARQEAGGEQSFGYSASIWRKASHAVFEAISKKRGLRTSPPLTYEELQIVERVAFNYFNLHGVEDGGDWYGQRDALFPANYPLFPVALRPQDLDAVDHTGAVVFTEACYGANTLGKTVEDSIALRFLNAGALSVVGSTKIAYGAIAPPLVGADLIGRYFWEGLHAGQTVGQALKFAKVGLAREVQARQGFLDDEDQKTLLSFVLYGDPSLPSGSLVRQPAPAPEAKALCTSIICQQADRRAAGQKGVLSEALIAKVKRDVETSLPYMTEARVRAAPLAFCDVADGLPASDSAKSVERYSGNWAITMEKNLRGAGDRAHRQFVRVTLDERGEMIKLAVSK